MEKAADELKIIIEEVSSANNIVSISEDIVDELYVSYILVKVKIVIATIFYWFLAALFVVYLLGSETISVPRWCKIIFSIGILKLIPVIRHVLEETIIDKFSEEVYKIFMKNQDKWSQRKG
jgi:hypothetical protein